jgi:3-oxoadipate enol-lactonase
MANTSPKGVAAALEALRSRTDFTPTLPSFDVPTLIVVGEQDVITPPAGAKAMHAAIRGSVLEEIPGAGHVPPLEQPVAFGRVLRRFLDGLKA